MRLFANVLLVGSYILFHFPGLYGGGKIIVERSKTENRLAKRSKVIVIILGVLFCVVCFGTFLWTLVVLDGYRSRFRVVCEQFCLATTTLMSNGSIK